MKKYLFVFACLFLTSFLFSQVNVTVSQLRDAMYNHSLNHEQLQPLYISAKEDLIKTLFGYDLYVALSRCEYYMGRSYYLGGQKDLAGECYDRGIEYAKKALEINEGDDAFVMYSENLSQNSTVKPTSYTLSNGLRIGSYAKEALKINENNAAAHYLLAAQYIYAPSPFHNHKKGIREMKEILLMPALEMEKDDEFNIISSIGYGYFQRKEYIEALPWIEAALAIYPNNVFAVDLKQKILKEHR